MYPLKALLRHDVKLLFCYKITVGCPLLLMIALTAFIPLVINAHSTVTEQIMLSFLLYMATSARGWTDPPHSYGNLYKVYVRHPW